MMSNKDILSILPHRYPFLLIDKVLEIKKHPDGKTRIGDEIKAIKNITFNEPQFQGHFPEFPIMPGVLMIEAMAQASALLGFRPHPTGGKWNFFMLGIDNARFRIPIIPGDTVEIHSKILKERGAFLTFACKAYVGKELKAEADIFAQMTL